MKWKSDFIQFPRLIAEICATQDLDIAALAESMDLSQEDVHSLLDRAQSTWETMSSPKNRFIVTSEPTIYDGRTVTHEGVVRCDDDGERWALAWVRLPSRPKSVDDRQLILPLRRLT